MKFIVIGIADNPQPYFPPEVMTVIRSGRVFSGGKRHHELVVDLLPKDAEWIDITVPLDAVFEQYRQCVCHLKGEGRAIIVFASGDPLFFGFANTILRKMPDAEIRVFPTFNSLQLLAHRLVMPYHDMHIVSLTGRPWPALDRALIERAPLIGVLTDREHTPQTIARRMLDFGFTNYTFHIGEHLGNPATERVKTCSISEAAEQVFSHPNSLILQSFKESQPRAFGIPETDFALLNGREKMITKMPIRLLSLQALDLPRRHVLWDIGFCTGSVSIEARLLFPHLQIEAFEIRPECEAIIHENMRRHHAPGINVRIGDFLNAECSADSEPDAVFIGGHGGQLKEIMAKVKAVLRPGGIVVMNSVSSPIVDSLTDRPSSRQLFEDACQELGLHLLPTTHIVLNDYNPIDILKCELPL